MSGARSLAAAASLVALTAARAASADVTIGSKAFTEGVIVGELATRMCAQGGARVRHARQLGGSVILWKALLAGEIDAYPEYTGTLAAELLHDVDPAGLDALRARLAPLGIAMSAPLGFDNTYALGVPAELARQRGLRTMSDLAAHPSLVFGLSHELTARADGWSGLRERYRLAPTDVRPMDHDVAYKAIAAGSIQVMDLYTTDAEIPALGLTVLEDDRRWFPAYRAVILHRVALAEREPGCVAGMRRLEGAIRSTTMRELNAEVKLRGRTEDEAAARFLAESLDVRTQVVAESRASRIARRTEEHVLLAGAALLASALVGIPAGIACARLPRMRAVVLGLSGIIQTIPSLALLVLLIPLLGIGTAPAAAALFLYSLFPVLEGTVTGLRGVPPSLRESAEALGLDDAAILRHVALPIASPSILSGVRTAAVLAVGTATIGAMVGAGGYGQPILTGVRLDSVPMILEGAVPAAALALAAQAAFRWLERLLVPRGLRTPDPS